MSAASSELPILADFAAHLSEVESRLAPLKQRARLAQRRVISAEGQAKLLGLQKDMAERILQRSELLSLAKDPANQKCV